MTVKTDQLIPGEYYWVKEKYNSEWDKAEASFESLAIWLKFKHGGKRTAESVYKIDCDKSGNPIPIKRPE